VFPLGMVKINRIVSKNHLHERKKNGWEVYKKTNFSALWFYSRKLIFRLIRLKNQNSYSARKMDPDTTTKNVNKKRWLATETSVGGALGEWWVIRIRRLMHLFYNDESCMGKLFRIPFYLLISEIKRSTKTII